MAKRIVFISLFVGGCFAVGGQARAGLVLTVEAAGVQSSSISSVTTEAFDGLNGGYFGGPLVTAVGTITSSGRINDADVYGGAGGSGKYVSFGYATGSETAVLQLNGPQAYFGAWWSAVDRANSMDFYSGDTLVGHFDPATDLGTLSGSYYGNPTARFLGQDSWESYAYVNVIATGGTTFDRVVFRNPDHGTGFELDNLSVRSTPVYLGGHGAQAVPEPGSLALVGMGGLVFLASRMRRRNRKSA